MELIEQELGPPAAAVMVDGLHRGQPLGGFCGIVVGVVARGRFVDFDVGHETSVVGRRSASTRAVQWNHLIVARVHLRRYLGGMP